MANEDLLLQLKANRASFAAAGFDEDVKKIDAKIAEVEKAGKPKAPRKKSTRKKSTTRRKAG